jgi:hypothetical protein
MCTRPLLGAHRAYANTVKLVKSEEQGGSFGPNEISVMTTAFNPIVRDLHLRIATTQ